MRNPETLIRDFLSSADVGVDGKRPWDIHVHNKNFYSRLLSEGSLGLGESYMDNWWDVDQLDTFFFKILRAGIEKGVRDPRTLLEVFGIFFLNRQSRKRSRRVAERHYDLGNEFYEHILDERMQYTCGFWKNASNLSEAQEHKLDLICRKLRLKSGDHVLELGGGWGGFAKYAAENYGCEITSYNISEEQVRYARQLCEGLPVKVVHEDYRDAHGVFDKVVSIGICEHVGQSNYRDFLNIKARCLRDDGLALLHTIGCNYTKRKTDPWIEKYVFPGGFLPSIKQIAQASEKLFVLEDLHNFGADYDQTLMAWFSNFEQNWPKFSSHYGDRFYRLWKYYLLSCAGAFRARSINLWQFVFSKKGISGGYAPLRKIEAKGNTHSLRPI